MEGLALTEPEIAPFVDFVIYLDADERDIRDWFVARFLSMFSEDLLDIAYAAWDEINVVNLHEHIFPARERADAVLEKRADHVVSRVVLRDAGHARLLNTVKLARHLPAIRQRRRRISRAPLP